MSDVAIYFDSSVCTACKGCQVACKCWNNLPSPLELNSNPYSGTYQNPEDLNGDTRIIITFDEKPRESGWGVDWAFGRRACMHCAEAECVKVCPSGCLHHDEETGMVVYDNEKCIGCQYCRHACPYDVPRHTGVSLAGGNIRINKCTGCTDRIKHGMSPACVSTCQPGALQFGDRDEMIVKAEQRVAYLQGKGFKDARVYGAQESGGTHVIYVLKYAIEQYSLPESDENGQFNAVLGAMKPLAAVAGVGVVAAVGVTMASAAGYKREDINYDPEAHELFNEKTGEVVRTIDVEAGER